MGCRVYLGVALRGARLQDSGLSLGYKELREGEGGKGLIKDPVKIKEKPNSEAT